MKDLHIIICCILLFNFFEPAHAENITKIVNDLKKEKHQYDDEIVGEIIYYYESQYIKKNKYNELHNILKYNRNQFKINSKDYFLHTLAEIEILNTNMEISEGIRLIHELDQNLELKKFKNQYTDFLTTASIFYFYNNKISLSNIYNYKLYTYAKEINSPIDKSIACSNLGMNYGKIGRYNKAIFYCKLALKEGKNTGHPDKNIKKNLAYLYLLKGDFDQSERLYLEIYEELKETNGAIEIALAHLYYKLRNNQKCKHFLEVATTLIQKTNENRGYKELFETKAEYFEATGDYYQSLFYKNKLDSINDILNNLNREYSIDSLEIVLHRQKQRNIEKRLKHTMNEHKESSEMWLFLFISSIFSTVPIYIKYTKFKKKNKELVRNQLINLEKDSILLKESVKTISERNEIDQELISKMDKIFFEKKLYLKSNISLQILAKKMGSNTSEISQLINVYYQENFRSLVNKARINEAKIMLSSEQFKNYTIEGIAITVGYKNQSTFNKKFKELTGVTPSFFQITANEIHNSEVSVEE